LITIIIMIFTLMIYLNYQPTYFTLMFQLTLITVRLASNAKYNDDYRLVYK